MFGLASEGIIKGLVHQTGGRSLTGLGEQLVAKPWAGDFGELQFITLGAFVCVRAVCV